MSSKTVVILNALTDISSAAAEKVNHLAATLNQQATDIKSEAGATAFDVLLGGATNAETEKELSAAKGKIETYQAVAGDLSILGATLAAGNSVPAFFCSEADTTVSIGKPRNVPTITLNTSLPFTYPEGAEILFCTQQGTYYGLVNKVDVVEGNADVSDETIVTAKVLGTLAMGLQEATATTSGRKSASKPTTSNKPSSANKTKNTGTVKKDAAAPKDPKPAPNRRKPREQKPTAEK